MLATILFTDIVRSTERAAAIGDQRWRRLLDRHDEVTGDGVLATFDARTRALRCAFALIDALGNVGIEIRWAIHTGEIEIRDNDVGRSASISRREPGSGRRSGGRRDPNRPGSRNGTDLAFGSVSLRGVPGEWELFSVSVG